jgi:hypothetical protein
MALKKQEFMRQNFFSKKCRTQKFYGVRGFYSFVFWAPSNKPIASLDLEIFPLYTSGRRMASSQKKKKEAGYGR